MRLTLALLILTALVATQAMAEEIKLVRSITVNGQAERKVVPDEAHIMVNLNAQDKDMKTARAGHDKKLEKLMNIVKSAGIDEKKVRTQSSNIQPIYTSKDIPIPTDVACEKAYTEKLKNLVHTPGMTLAPCPSGSERKTILEGYRAQTNVDITVADNKKLSGLIEAITGAGFEQGANNEWGDLMNISYTLSNPDKIREDMLVEAIANAKEKAGHMASAAGANLGSVYTINEAGTPQFQPMMAPMPRAMLAKSSMMAEDAAMAPPAGEQVVNASVTVTYELK